jgi:hypothetical protein
VYLQLLYLLFRGGGKIRIKPVLPQNLPGHGLQIDVNRIRTHRFLGNAVGSGSDATKQNEKATTLVLSGVWICRQNPGYVVFLKGSLRSLAVGNFPWKFPVTS